MASEVERVLASDAPSEVKLRAVLEEFVSDCEAAASGREPASPAETVRFLQNDWFDLAMTYAHAKRALGEPIGEARAANEGANGEGA